MKRELKNLILIYLGFVLVKIILSYLIPSSRALADDYQYLKMSESFYYHFSLKVHDTFSGQFYPLYPIVISIAQVFQDNNLVYFTIKVINSILSTLIIFPTYYLSKEFLSEKKSLFAATFIALLPANFALTSYIMAENLFYVLFLTSIYFIYKSFKYKSNKNYFFAGLFTILALLTRIHALVLVALIIILLALGFIKRKFDYKYLFFIILVLISLALWFLYSKSIILNLYTNEALSLIKSKEIIAFIIKYISYFGYLLLSLSLVMLPFFITFKINNEKLRLFRKISLITIFISLFLAANHAINSPRYFFDVGNLTLIGGRIIGRYVDFCLPLIAILSFIGLEHYYKKQNIKLLKKSALFASITMLFTTSIIFSPLVPLNNISLTIFGAVKYIVDTLFYSKVSFEFGATLASFIILGLIFMLIPWINYYILKKLNYRKFISLLLALMIISSLISVFVVYYAASTSWYYNSEQRQLALYLNNINPKRSIVLIDERDRGDLGGATYDQKALYVGAEKSKYTILGYWLNDELIIGNVNNTKADYIISTHELNLEKLYSTNNGIYLYKN